ncbi:MAG: PQQ-binding-like beta-propeller repeat protein [Tepidisphaeraceae bacterium]|jgi:outer membrane protein assembly factor BamB
MRRVLYCLVLLASISARADVNWPGFRGPSGQGVAEGNGYPLSWDENREIVWKTAIPGKAWSSPVIWDQSIWMTTATEDGRTLSVICVDRASGKIVRNAVIFNIQVPQYCIPFNSYASPTPVIEPGRLYATWGSPGTACIDTATGQVLWKRTDFVCNHYRGAGSSPLLWNDLLIMHFDGSDRQYVAALDKNTGRNVWQTNRSVDYKDLGPDGKPEREGDWRKAFSTPRVLDDNGRPLLVSLGSKCLYAYNPADGKEIWQLPTKDSHSGPTTPVFGRGLIFYCTGLGNQELQAVKPSGEIVWKMSRNAPGRVSPLLVDDLLYIVDDNGVTSCLEADTGAEVWRQRLKGNYSASPMYAAGRVYLFNQDGLTYVLQPGREGKILSQNSLDAGCMATPAAVNGAFYIRTKTHLYRVEELKK